MVRAKDIVVEFLSAFDEELSVKQLLRAARAFGLSESSLRVALVRLRNEGRIVSTRRGVYALGEVARPVHQRVLSWRDTDSLVRAWSGDWIAVSYAELQDRTALRHAERALRLFGFRDFRPRLALRPDNLILSLDTLREQLRALGLTSAMVCRMSDLGDADRDARKLWNGSVINDGYDEMCDALETSRDRLPHLQLDDAVRESFEIGREAIRLLVLDPLLPEPLVDATKRNAVQQAMLDYDAAGRVLWGEFIFETRSAA